MENTTVKQDEDIKYGGEILHIERQYTDKTLRALHIITEGGQFTVETGTYQGIAVTAPTEREVFILTAKLVGVYVYEQFPTVEEANTRMEELVAAGADEAEIDETVELG